MLEVMVFPRTMTDFGHVLDDDAIVVVKGRVDLRDDAPKLIAMEIVRPELVLDGGEPVKIKVKLHALTDEKAALLKAVSSDHPGDSAVFVHLESAREDHRAPPRRRLPRRRRQRPLRRAPRPPRQGLHRLISFLARCSAGYPPRGRSLGGAYARCARFGRLMGCVCEADRHAHRRTRRHRSRGEGDRGSPRRRSVTGWCSGPATASAPSRPSPSCRRGGATG